MSETPSNDTFDYETQFRLIREALEPEFKALLDANVSPEEAEDIITKRIEQILENPEEEL